MINYFKYFLILAVVISCKKEQEVQEIKKDSSIVKSKTINENPRDQVQHLFIANGGSILYLKNGEIKGQARFDTDGDFITELMKTETYGHYTDYDDYLIDKKNKDTIFFFNDFGKIDEGWSILKGISIENPMQVVSYKSPKNPNPSQTETISETRLIILSPETKTFADENSEEAEAYFTAMDDWNFYSLELNESFEKLGVKTHYMKKRFLGLDLPNHKSITIDTKSKINGYNALAFLYKKGRMPIIVSLIFSDNDLDEVKEYLN
ncbi:hypothetical protein J2X97_001210 [Epilithonimonas hungarica]|uniref:hypothetical protein n=1 Tax=Epilithonimonas hungarica TaxID=454006 RepID=UPI0027811226|nr:hypothetical protein [Epilithonimonas hungarica]MDP9955573.1 hypothetical protein [Epilithonimonas hungarica]